MSRQNWQVGRFTLQETTEGAILVARDARDKIQITVNGHLLTFSQKRTAGEPIVLRGDQTALVRAEKIGGPKNAEWALKSDAQNGEETLLLHSLSETEARSLAALLHQHCQQFSSQLLPPPPAATSPPSPAPPAPDSWSLEAWRNEPPIGPGATS